MKNNKGFWKNRGIFPAITTITKSAWREKIEEIKNLELKEVCLFLTCLKEKERNELYKLLEKTKVRKIPLVHLRSDMKLKEVNFFVKNYKTRAFNIHTQTAFPLVHDLSKYKDIIYVENVFIPYDENEIKEFGGICLDFAHLENDRLLAKKRFKENTKILEKHPIRCNHISAIKKTTRITRGGRLRYDAHFLEDFSELDYLKKYPANYFSPIIAVELENNIKEQLEAIKYIRDLLKDI